MTTSTELRQMWAAYRCDTGDYTRVAFPTPTSTISLYIAKPTKAAFEALAGIMRKHRYYFRETAGGTYNCRYIGGTTTWSLHAYAIALDLNPSKNKFGQCGTDMPQAFVNDVLALRTGNGKQAFTWGGNWRPCSSADPMHFQIDVSPADAATGIQGQQPPPGDDDVEEVVKGIQRSLNAAGFKGANGLVLTVDGIWGTNTEYAFTTMCKDAQSDTGTGGVTMTQVNAAIATHAKVRASANIHPHAHSEGTTGPPV
jgi:hypothetical protein